MYVVYKQSSLLPVQISIAKTNLSTAFKFVLDPLAIKNCRLIALQLGKFHFPYAMLLVLTKLTRIITSIWPHKFARAVKFSEKPST